MPSGFRFWISNFGIRNLPATIHIMVCQSSRGWIRITGMETSKYISELSKCVLCGGCKAYCPTYHEDLTESMGARGRLTLLHGLHNRQLKPSPILNERIFSCTLCGACENLCPPQVDITEVIYHGRKLLMESEKKNKYLRQLIRFSVLNSNLSFKIARMLFPLIYPYLIKKGITNFDITLPQTPLRDEQQVYKPEKKIGRVALFTGCSTNFLFPHLGVSLINVLLHLGYEVVLPKGEVCCGIPLRSIGFEEEAIDLARKNYSIFSKLQVEAILSLCPTCILSIKHQYPKLIGQGLEKATDVSVFLADKIGALKLPPISSLKSVTYHDPCHLNYSLGIKKEPREIIRQTGVELIDADGEGCCGFGGVFSLEFKELSRQLLKKRVGNYLSTGADAIVTSCPGCMMQLSSGTDKSVFHLIELIEEAVCQ